jgi:glycosyltransferase involved in cell wall biosynthesis
MDQETKVAMFLPNLCGGGAERVATHLANGLTRRRFGVEMVLSEAKGPFLADLAPEVRVVDLHARHAMTSIWPLCRYLRKAKPDVLFSHLDYVNVAALLARRLAHVRTCVIPVVHITHSQARQHSRSSREPILRAAIKWLYPTADQIVAVSRGAADDMIRVTGVPAALVRVIYNPVITPVIEALAAEPVDHPWFAPGQVPVILGIGRLARQKEFATLIRAFAVLRKDRDCRLMILGDGEDRDALERLVKELGVAENVALPGHVKNPFSYLARCALFGLSSAWEALPTVVIEALSLGVRVVSTDCPSGPREILQGGQFGALVPVGDVEALARAMSEALGKPRPEVPAAVLLPYTMDAAADRYAELIAEVLHARRTGGRRS